MTPQTERVRIPPEPDDERLYSSGKTLRRQRGNRRFNSGQPLQTNARSWRGREVMHHIRNEDQAGSISAAISKMQERLYDECNDDAGISGQCRAMSP